MSSFHIGINTSFSFVLAWRWFPFCFVVTIPFPSCIVCRQIHFIQCHNVWQLPSTQSSSESWSTLKTLCCLFVRQLVSFLFLFVLHSEVHVNNMSHYGLQQSILPRRIALTRLVGAIDDLCDFVYEPLCMDKWLSGVLALFLAGRFFLGLFLFGIEDAIDCLAAN